VTTPLVAALPARSPAPLAAELLVDIAAGLAASTALVEAVARHDPAARRPVRLLATAHYEAWVIGWTPGQRVEPHDHGPSLGVVAVTEGALTELHVEHGGPGPRLAARLLEAGSVHVVPVGAVHDIVNRGPAPATSVHVYSPPISEMTRYDETLAPLGTVAVGHERPALPGAAASLLLHPSARGA
jgi:predicted metal-dependent enzyme (double-stranded beta helix superfamily)